MNKNIKVISTKNDSILAEFNNMMNAQAWIDNILECVAGFHFMSELNTIQIESGGVFKYKSDIPVYFMNLVIRKFNMAIKIIDIKG
jgi:hypothetical protein